MGRNVKFIAVMLLILALSIPLAAGCGRVPTPNNNLPNNNNPNDHLSNNPGAAVNQNYTVYFANDDYSRLMKEERTYTKNYEATNVVDRAKETLNSLIEGPKNAANKAILSGKAAVNSVTLDNAGVLHVDFSSNFLEGHNELNATEEMTIYSIVNSLAEYPEVKKVSLTMNGSPLKIRETVYSEPLARNMLL